MIPPASIRNNNPGAQYPGPSARKFGSTRHEVLRSKDGQHLIATFPTPVHGAAAQFDLLHNGRNKLGQLTYRNRTIRKAIETWCGGFYANTYLGVLKSKAGVTADSVLTSDLLKDPVFAIPLGKAMAWQEAGREYPLDDEGWTQAHDMAFADSRAPAFAPDNDVPSPKPETRSAAAVTAAQVGLPVTAGLAGAGTIATAPIVPPPPDMVTKAVENASAYQQMMTSVADMLTWLVGNPGKAVVAIVVIGGLGWLAPYLARRVA